MASYWVVGGEYRSTAFEEFAPGTNEVREGPFETYDEALRAWARLAWQSVDNCNVRFIITKDENAAAA